MHGIDKTIFHSESDVASSEICKTEEHHVIVVRNRH